MTQPEFSRPLRAATIGDAPRRIELAAEPAERAALAERFGLPALDGLEAEVEVWREGAAIRATGRVRAALAQSCVATGEPLSATIDEPFALRFVEASPPAPDEEVELDADDLDTMPIVDGTIDLGEAAAETLALALDPFPRSPDADAILRKAGVLTEEEAAAAASPFGTLKGLLG